MMNSITLTSDSTIQVTTLIREKLELNLQNVVPRKRLVLELMLYDHGIVAYGPVPSPVAFLVVQSAWKLYNSSANDGPCNALCKSMLC